MAHAKGRGALQRKPTSFYGDNDEAQAMSQHLFSKLDYDGSGYLDTEEMRRARELMLSVSVNSDSARISGDALGGTLSELIKDLDFNHDGQIDDEEWDTFNRSLYEVLGQKQYLRIARTWATNLSHSSEEASPAAASRTDTRKPTAGSWRKSDGTAVPTEELDHTSGKAWRHEVRRDSLSSVRTETLGQPEGLHRASTDMGHEGPQEIRNSLRRASQDSMLMSDSSRRKDRIQTDGGLRRGSQDANDSLRHKLTSDSAAHSTSGTLHNTDRGKVDSEVQGMQATETGASSATAAAVGILKQEVANIDSEAARSAPNEVRFPGSIHPPSQPRPDRSRSPAPAIQVISAVRRISGPGFNASSSVTQAQKATKLSQGSLRGNALRKGSETADGSQPEGLKRVLSAGAAPTRSGTSGASALPGGAAPRLMAPAREPVRHHSEPPPVTDSTGDVQEDARTASIANRTLALRANSKESASTKFGVWEIEAEKVAAELVATDKSGALQNAAEQTAAELAATENLESSRSTAEKTAAELAATEKATLDMIAAAAEKLVARSTESDAAERENAVRPEADGAVTEKEVLKEALPDTETAEEVEAKKVAHRAAADKAAADKGRADKPSVEKEKVYHRVATVDVTMGGDAAQFLAEKAAAEKAEVEKRAAEKAEVEKRAADKVAARLATREVAYKAAADKVGEQAAEDNMSAAQKEAAAEVAAKKVAANDAPEKVEKAAAEKAALRASLDRVASEETSSSTRNAAAKAFDFLDKAAGKVEKKAEKADEAAAEAAAKEVCCPCGNDYQPDSLFCRKCGAKREETKPSHSSKDNLADAVTAAEKAMAASDVVIETKQSQPREDNADVGIAVAEKAIAAEVAAKQTKRRPSKDDVAIAKDVAAEAAGKQTKRRQPSVDNTETAREARRRQASVDKLDPVALADRTKRRQPSRDSQSMKKNLHHQGSKDEQQGDHQGTEEQPSDHDEQVEKAAILMQKMHRGKLARQKTQELKKIKEEEEVKKETKKKPKAHTLITLDELFDLMCCLHGHMVSRLGVDDIVDAYMKFLLSGFSVELARYAPQTSDFEGEDLTAGQVLNLCMLLVEFPNDEVDEDEDLFRDRLIYSPSDAEVLKSFGHNEGTLNLKLFRRLFKIICTVTCIDEVYITSQFVWVLFNRLDLPDVLVARILADCAHHSEEHSEEHDGTGSIEIQGAIVRVTSSQSMSDSSKFHPHRKHAPAQGADMAAGPELERVEHDMSDDEYRDLTAEWKDVEMKHLKSKFKLTDLSRMSHAVGLVDPHEKTGLPFVMIGHIFSTVAIHISELLQARLDNRPKAQLGGWVAPKKAVHDIKELRRGSTKRTPDARQDSLRGGTQLTILIEAIFHALPRSAGFQSPMHLCMTMLENAKSSYASGRG